MTYGDVSADCPGDITNLFARFFQSVYVRHVDVPVRMPELNDVVISDIIVDSDLVFAKLVELDRTKGPGPDRIPPAFLFNCSPTLAVPLSLIYNQSLRSGVFPSLWKLAHITALFKGGDRSDISNYRPISGLDSSAKVLEMIVVDALCNGFHGSISVYQHGFVPGRSCQTNLCLYTNFLATALERGSQVDSVYFDCRKAFDRVSHQILIKKLKLYGVSDPLLSWLKSYLEDRRQMVKLDSVLSNEITVHSGVPQGSHLGPILFLIFVNDLGSVFDSSSCLLFADDLKIYRRIDSMNDCLLLQGDIDRLTSWCSQNNVELNISKCKFISFTRKRQPTLHVYTVDGVRLSRVTSVTDLGVVFDSELRFTSHIDWVISKAFRMLGFVLRQCHDFKDVEVLKIVYYSLIRSHLEYCCPIWSPHYGVHISRLERVQMKFVNFLLFKLRIDKAPLSHDERRIIVGMDSLELRRIKLTLTFGHKILINRIDCTDLLAFLNFRVPARDTRLRETFHLNASRTDVGINEFCNRFMRLYNKYIPHDFDYSCSIFSFKNSLRRLLMIPQVPGSS